MIFPVFAAALLILLVFAGRFFVSVEFWLYPFLISKGLVPYIDLVDQHLPGILFGPISFETLKINTLEKATVMYALMLIMIVFLVFNWYQKHCFQSWQKYLLTLIFIFAYFLLDGNHMWIEQWSLLAVLVSLNMSHKKGIWGIISGFILAFALLNRPFSIGIVGLVFLLSADKFSLILGGSIYFLTVGIWIFRYENLQQMLSLLKFSKDIYAELAYKLPTNNQLLTSGFILGLVTYISRKQPIIFIGALIGILCAWPRFEYYHLVLFVFVMLFYDTKISRIKLIGVCSILAIMSFVKVTPLIFENFYKQSSVTDLGTAISRIGPETLYMFGGPDQIYVFNQLAPAGNYYLPSLNWYHKNPKYINEQIAALEKTERELVVLNKNSVVDGVNLIQSSNDLYNYVLAHYKKVGSFGDYDFMQEIPTIATTR